MKITPALPHAACRQKREINNKLKSSERSGIKIVYTMAERACERERRGKKDGDA
jgi:hypothetical protein